MVVVCFQLVVFWFDVLVVQCWVVLVFGQQECYQCFGCGLFYGMILVCFSFIWRVLVSFLWVILNCCLCSRFLIVIMLCVSLFLLVSIMKWMFVLVVYWNCLLIFFGFICILVLMLLVCRWWVMFSDWVRLLLFISVISVCMLLFLMLVISLVLWSCQNRWVRLIEMFMLGRCDLLQWLVRFLYWLFEQIDLICGWLVSVVLQMVLVQ